MHKRIFGGRANVYKGFRFQCFWRPPLQIHVCGQAWAEKSQDGKTKTKTAGTNNPSQESHHPPCATDPHTLAPGVLGPLQNPRLLAKQGRQASQQQWWPGEPLQPMLSFVCLSKFLWALLVNLYIGALSGLSPFPGHPLRIGF